MPIQYGNLDPFRGLTGQFASGVQTGALMRRQDQKEQKSNVDLPDAGSANYTTLSQFMANDITELGNYEKTYKDTVDKSKPETLTNLQNNYKSNSALINAAARNGVNPKDLSNILNNIVNGNQPDVYINKLKDVIGKDDSKLVDQMLSQYSTIIKTQREDRKNYLKKIVPSYIDVIENPKDYIKNGMVSDSTAATMQRIPAYIKELSELDPEWAKQDINRRKGGGEGSLRSNMMKVYQDKVDKGLLDPETNTAYKRILGILSRNAVLGEKISSGEALQIDNIINTLSDVKAQKEEKQNQRRVPNSRAKRKAKQNIEDQLGIK